MNSVMLLGLLLGQAQSAPPVEQPEFHGTLWPREGRPSLYRPQEGDVLLLSSVAPGFGASYLVARTFHPFHSAIVARRSDGTLVLLESGGYSPRRVTMDPIEVRMEQYVTQNKRGHIWVRRNRLPLRPEQSAALTAFGETQLEKPFTPWRRLALYFIPGRPLAPASLDAPDWFCSEIVIQGMVQAGMVSVAPRKVSKITPRDMFFDRIVDLSPRLYAPVSWSKTCNPPPVPPCWFPRE